MQIDIGSQVGNQRIDDHKARLMFFYGLSNKAQPARVKDNRPIERENPRNVCLQRIKPGANGVGETVLRTEEQNTSRVTLLNIRQALSCSYGCCQCQDHPRLPDAGISLDQRDFSLRNVWVPEPVNVFSFDIGNASQRRDGSLRFLSVRRKAGRCAARSCR